MAPGVVIASKYRLLRQVGEGAMGAVWAARNDATSGEVAIKLILRPDAELRQRLQREARAGAMLKHRHILDVYDIGETDTGEPFLVMQLLSGETLADLLHRKRRLDPPMAALIGRDIAKALSTAHAMRLVHRDLKPANVFLHQEPGEEEPVVKVLDFGVAKDLSSSDSLRTALGSVVGSLYYMSPEQARAQADIDHRADIWALGVVLFEMLTGIRPFQGDANEVFAGVQNAEIPSVSKYVRRVDEGLVRIVASCLKRDREERYGAAAEVAKLLNGFTGGGAAAGAGAGSGAGIAGAVGSATGRPSSAPPSDTTLALPGMDVTLVLGQAQGPAEAADAAGARSLEPQEAATAVLLPPATPQGRGRGGMLRLDAGGEASKAARAPSSWPAKEAMDPAAGGRTSTEPLVKVTEVATAPVDAADRGREGTPQNGRRRGKTLVAAAAGIAIGVGLSGAALLLVLPRVKREPSPALPEGAATPVTGPTRPMAVSPRLEGATVPSTAVTAPQPAAAPAPEGTAAIEPPPTALTGSQAPPPLQGKLDKDPCADKAGFLLTMCRKEQRQEEALDPYKDQNSKPSDSQIEPDPYETSESKEIDPYGP